MDENKIEDLIDHQRWLINNGLLNPIIQDNLYMYGLLSHQNIQELDVEVDIINKKVKYSLFFDSKMIKIINRFNELREKKNLWGTWMFLRFLVKHGNLDFQTQIDRMIKDYCGPKWSSSVVVLNVSEHKNQKVKEAD